MRSTAKVFKHLRHVGIEDLFGFIGISSLLYGIHMLSRPAAFITGGVACLALSAVVILRTKKKS